MSAPFYMSQGSLCFRGCSRLRGFGLMSSCCHHCAKAVSVCIAFGTPQISGLLPIYTKQFFCQFAFSTSPRSFAAGVQRFTPLCLKKISTSPSKSGVLGVQVLIFLCPECLQSLSEHRPKRFYFCQGQQFSQKLHNTCQSLKGNNLSTSVKVTKIWLIIFY